MTGTGCANEVYGIERAVNDDRVEMIRASYSDGSVDGTVRGVCVGGDGKAVCMVETIKGSVVVGSDRDGDGAVISAVEIVGSGGSWMDCTCLASRRWQQLCVSGCAA